MQAVLVMFRSDGERRSFSVTRDMTVVGRREDCDLRIPLGEVSRKHCRLVRDGDTLRLEDLGSSNGTFLNGQRVQESVLQPGDSVQIGPVIFVLQVDGYPADDELNPVSAAMVEAQGAGMETDNLGPLSPTTQSEVADLVEGLDPVGAAGVDLGLEPLPEEAAHGAVATPPPAPGGLRPQTHNVARSEPADDLDLVPRDSDVHHENPESDGMELLPLDEDESLGTDSDEAPLELDGLEEEPHSHHPHA